MKHWLYPTGIERDYLAAIRRMQVRPLEQAIKDNILPILPDVLAQGARQDAATPQWFDTVRGAFETTLRQANVPENEIRAITERVAGGVDGFNRKEFEAVLKSVYRVDVITKAPAALQQALGVFEAQNIALIKSIPVQALATLQGKIVDAVRTGATLKDTQAMIRNTYGVTDRRAALIARDQVGKLNGQLTRLRQEAMGITEYLWRGILDARERPEHVAREGRKYSWDKPPDDGHPGEPIRCFPASTAVAFANGYDKLWRHEYSGPLAAIVTAEGALLEATPNHPVLSLRGWVALGDLDQSDHVLQALPYRRGVKKIDVDYGVPSFEKVFNLASLNVLSFTAPASGFDFHGETPQQQVDVVDADRSVTRGAMAGQAQRFEQFDFAGADIDLADAVLHTLGSRRMGFADDAARIFPKCVVGLARERLALVIAQMRHAYQVGLSAGTDWQCSGADNAIDDLAGDAVIFGKLKTAQPLQVLGHDGGFVQVGAAVVCWTGLAGGRVDATQAEVLAQVIGIAGEQDAYFFEGSSLCYKPLRVIEKSTREYAGPVFNAGTQGGWYMVGHNAIVAHNCRCSAEPVLPSWEEMEKRVTGQEPPEGTYTPPARAPAPRPPPPPAPAPTQPQLPGIPRPPKPAQPVDSAEPRRPIEPIEPVGPIAPPRPEPTSTVRTKPRRAPTPDDEEYVDYYKTGGMQKMNEILRNPGAYTAGELEAARAMRDRIEQVIDKSSVSREGTLYRGVASREIFENAGSLVGATIPVRTPQSASNSRGSALSWLTYVAAGVVLRIKAEQGAAALDIGALTSDGEQREILLPSGGVYRVTRVSTVDDVRYVDAVLERVPVISASTEATPGEFVRSGLVDQVVRVNANVYEVSDILRAMREADEARAGLR